jgi:5-methylcytosine-specific restriction enzyme A
MSEVKFKISLNECKKHGLYNSSSSFLDLEKSLQEKCKYILSLGELRNDKNIDQYRESIHRNKKYEKTSISIRFDLPEIIINKYGFQEKDNSEGKKLFQHEHIFTTDSGEEYFFNDDEYQKEILLSVGVEILDTPQEKKKTKNVNGNLIYPRNPAHAKKVILDANFSCEISPEHKTFIQRFNLKPFTEAHHLIPLRYHNEFKFSLDVPANIISLCPNCHRKLHFGQLEEIESLLKFLLTNRIKRLSKCGLEVPLNKLKIFYE